MSLASLYARSALVLALLFTLFFGISSVGGYLLELPMGTIIAIALLMLLLNFLISPLLIDWIYQIEWVELSALPDGLASWVLESCARHGKPAPRFGIIHDGSPNAFTYGNWPSNARVVLTRGLMESLDEEELKGVVGHELGHVFHYDFIVMTAASFIPMLFYYTYRTAMRYASSRGGGGKKDNRSGALLFALVALLLYWISHYLVLFLSRTREYMADRFAGQETGRPDRLATALVKIAYGLVGAQEKDLTAARGRGEAPVDRPVAVGGALGIFDFTAAKAVAVAAQVGTENQEAFELAARWELWNPWALIYEIQSTHPLAVKRVRALAVQSEQMGLTPPYRFSEERPESFWDELVIDLFMHYLPWAAALVGLGLASVGKGLLGSAIWSISFLVSTAFRYPAQFLPHSVIELLGHVKVSQIRPVPAEVTGRIIGRGTPGFFLSEDLVLQDETGYILLDYRQPGAIFEWFFALFRAAELVGERVHVQGWYRRAPVPYVEISRISGEDGRRFTSYVLHARIALALLIPLVIVLIAR